MDFWTGQLELAQRQIAEIEEKISLQRQKTDEVHAHGGDTALQTRLLAVMEESLVRAKAHAQYIEGRIAVHRREPDRRRRRAAARQTPVGGQAQSV